MFTSRLEVDLDIAPGRLWLRNLYRVHQRLCMAFPSTVYKEGDPEFLKPFDPGGFQHVHGPRTAEQAFLFRIDPQPGGNPVIVVQSALKPDWEYAFHNAGYLLACHAQVKTFDPSFGSGDRLQFRLVVNPTKRLTKNSRGGDGQPVSERWAGKRVPVPWDEIAAWLTSRAARLGFTVEGLGNLQTGYVDAYKGKYNNSQREGTDNGGEENSPRRLFYARYEGILKVTDAELFRNTLVRGIGPGKAFGFGLLSVAPVKGVET